MWPFTSSTTTNEEAPPSACPVDHDTRTKWLQDQNSSPSSSPSPRRPAPPEHRLSEEREVSSIPRWLPPSSGSSSSPPSPEPSPSSSSSVSVPPSSCPAHDPSFQSQSQPSTPPLNSAEKAAILPSESNWVYPSPSSFYRALSAKNRSPNPADMDIVVPIHNAVNERVWQQVLEWERNAMGLKEGEETGVRLVSFMGRPKEMSPRARWKSLIGYTAPFDRHDWIIDRPVHPPSTSSAPSEDPSSSSTTSPESIRVRYVIDFYTGRGANLLSQLPPAPSASTSSASSGSSPTATGTTSKKEEGPESVMKMMPNLAFFIDCRPALDGWEGVRMRFKKYWGIGEEGATRRS
ncbi:uncharacterized protein JCM6883_004490 [Sporobolomyces salmoneus]|uniref:uncharacterized protein n=1 Tax=Sporobolomyces salmoneus TaxID=183962 RepID=UPI00316BFBD4